MMSDHAKAHDIPLVLQLVLNKPRTPQLFAALEAENYAPHILTSATTLMPSSSPSPGGDPEWKATILEASHMFYKTLAGAPTVFMRTPRQVTVDLVYVWWHRWRMEDGNVYGPSTDLPSDEVIADNVAVDELFSDEKRGVELAFADFAKVDRGGGGGEYDDQLLMLRFYFNRGRTFSLLRLPKHWSSSSSAAPSFLFYSDPFVSHEAERMEQSSSQVFPATRHMFHLSTHIASMHVRYIEDFMRKWDAAQPSPYFYAC